MDLLQLGTRIKVLRESAGMLASELADKVGLDPTALSKVENGRRNLKSRELIAIAQALQVSPVALLEPDSLLGRLASSTRRPKDAPTHANAYDKLMSLIELHEVLVQASVHSSPNLASFNDAPPGDLREQAQEFARRARKQLNLAEGTADPFSELVSRIPRAFGVDVLVEGFQDDPTRGAAIVDASFPLIFVNAYQSRSKAMFMIAHQLGHLVAPQRSTRLVLDDEATLHDSDDEVFATTFASSLLMPEQEVIEAIGSDPTEFGSVLVELASSFGVGFEAVVHRLRDLDFISAEDFDRLRDMPWDQLERELAEPDRERLTWRATANLQARGITSLPYIPPATLVARAMSGYSRGAISATPLARLLQVPPEMILDNDLHQPTTPIPHISFTNHPTRDDNLPEKPRALV